MHAIHIVNPYGKFTVMFQWLKWSFTFPLSDAVADILSDLNGVELFQFGDESSNIHKSQSMLQNMKDFSDDPPSHPLVHEEKYNGKYIRSP